jgi:flagellar motor switch protein FliM
MNQVLSQNEVDALLSVVGDGNAEIGKNPDEISAGFDEAEENDVEVTAYDLANQDRVIRGRMPALDMLYERFIRQFRVSISNSLRKMSSLSLISTDMLKFGEFINTLPIPSCIGIMRLEALRGPALIVFESKLVYALLDAYFGGTDKSYTKIEGKEYTTIELSIIKRVIDLAIHDLEEAWAPTHKTKISYIRTEVNPQFVGIIPPTDVIIATTFELELDNASGTIMLILPYSTIEPIKHKLTAAFQTETNQHDKVWTKTLSEHLNDVETELRVNLGSTTITVGDLINLNVGDIIPLTQDADGELEVIMEGKPKFKCLFGISRGNRAVQITKVLNE